MLNRFVYLSVMMLALISTNGLFAQSNALPNFFAESQWDSTVISNTVNYFVEKGEDAAIEELKDIVSQDYFSNKIDITFRVACLCRILWENSDDPIPPPHLGMYFGGVSLSKDQLSDWPRFPIAKSGKSYFLVIHGGRGGTGQTTDISKYIDQCRQSGRFLEESIPVPTADEAAADANQLRISQRWVSEFMNSSDRNIWKSIQSQIPDQPR